MGAWARELAKWALVIILLLPLRKAGQEQIDFARIALGIMLFVIFSGKMLYDALINNYKRNGERTVAADLFSALAMVVIMALVVALVVASIGLMVYAYLQQASAPPQS